MARKKRKGKERKKGKKGKKERKERKEGKKKKREKERNRIYTGCLQMLLRKFLFKSMEVENKLYRSRNYFCVIRVGQSIVTIEMRGVSQVTKILGTDNLHNRGCQDCTF